MFEITKSNLPFSTFASPQPSQNIKQLPGDSDMRNGSLFDVLFFGKVKDSCLLVKLHNFVISI